MKARHRWHANRRVPLRGGRQNRSSSRCRGRAGSSRHRPGRAPWRSFRFPLPPRGSRRSCRPCSDTRAPCRRAAANRSRHSVRRRLPEEVPPAAVPHGHGRSSWVAVLSQTAQADEAGPSIQAMIGRMSVSATRSHVMVGWISACGGLAEWADYSRAGPTQRWQRVRARGLEPPPPSGDRDLNPARLPIPPRPQRSQ